MKIVVQGLWHLGSVTAACCAKHFSVIGLDFDEANIAKLNSGEAPLQKPPVQTPKFSGSLTTRRSTTPTNPTLNPFSPISAARSRICRKARSF
jgi:UDPglucose 6-dehydrogenase